MNNFVIGLKRFFSNKNVVTILLVLVILGVLYYGYSSSIKKQTNPINVPVAAKEIPPQTKITNEDIRITKIAGSMVSSNIVTNRALLDGMYTKVNVTIPEGSVFYSEWLDVEKNIPGNWIEQLDHEAGELGYYMSVDIESTLGNSVLPDTYIDIYMKATNDDGTVMFGKLLKNIKVLVVHDASGNNVFSGMSASVDPAKIGFAVSPDMYALLHKVEYLNDVSLIIAPRGSKSPEDCENNCVVVTSSTLRNYIDSRATTYPEDVITKKETEGTSDNTQIQPAV